MLRNIFKLLGFKRKENQEKSILDKQIEESIQAFLHRHIYKTLTKEILDTIKDDDLEQTIFDNISARMENIDFDEFTFVEKLSKGEQMIYSTWAVEAEVNNGGFNQFYFNSSGVFSEMAVDGFKLIGAEKFSNLLENANKTYNKNKENLEKFDNGTVESFIESYKDNPLNELDNIFYESYSEENLKELKIIYIRNNINEFIQK